MTKRQIKKYWWKKSRNGFIHKVLVMIGIRKSPTLEEWLMWGIPAKQYASGLMNFYRGLQ